MSYDHNCNCEIYEHCPKCRSRDPVALPNACRVTDEILRRQAEEIRAEVARLAPHWARYEAERAHITTEGKRKMADLNWTYTQGPDVNHFSEDYFPSRWQRFVRCLRNLFTR